MSDPPVIPDFEWYSHISERRGPAPRCPYASVERCPRYYQSLSLLGEAGSTKIDSAEDERLLERWKQSDLWPRTDEYATSVSGPSGEPKNFSNFCPEVSYDRFGCFASYLGRYADEIDSGIAHEGLGDQHAPQNDPRWNWSNVRPMHYTECPLYSPLANAGSPLTEPAEENVEITVGPAGLAVRFDFPWHRARQWWSRVWKRLIGVVSRPSH